MTIIYDSAKTHRYEVRAYGVERRHRFLWGAKFDAFLLATDGNAVQIIDYGKETD